MELTDLITKFFDSSFASRWDGACTGWTKGLVICHVVADLLIWLAYMTIPLLLIRIRSARKDVPFNIFFVLFAIFIVGCGMTHFAGAVIAFYPYYYIDFWIKAITAVASIATAYMLWKMYPQIVSIKNPIAMEKKLHDLDEVLYRCQDAVIVIDANGYVEVCNDATEKMLFWGKEDMIGRKLSDTCVPKRYVERYELAIKNILSCTKKFEPFKVDLEALRKDGTELSVSVGVFELRGKRYCGIIRNITDKIELVESYKNLTKTNKELARVNKANKMLEDFALIAAHDLQDPLKQNQVFVNLIEAGKDEFLPELAKNNARLSDFVRKLLDFARSGGTRLDIEEISIKNVIDDLLKDLSVNIKNDGAKVIVGTMPVVRCDPVQMRRVFQNFISNALRAKHEDRQLVIEITSKKIDGVWHFCVSDNGKGIEENNIPNLFTIYRGKKTDNTGAGFGMAICKRIIDGHNGEIFVKSKVGVGTSFTFSIGNDIEEAHEFHMK